MQIDMHYYATYCIARLAGINQSASTIIAGASQFVDDNTSFQQITSIYSTHFELCPTSYDIIDKENWDPDSQKTVWLPFHFIPGNQGDTYTERLACQKNSTISNEIFNTYIEQTNKPFYLELIGIITHIYADTFSHYGFSGVSSKNNRVDANSFHFEDLNSHIKSYITGKKDELFSKISQYFQDFESTIAEDLSGALGHAGAATFPDRPYLKWSFIYETDKTQSNRNNIDTYVEYCECIYNKFQSIAAKISPISDNSQLKNWSDIKDKIRTLISFQSDCPGRIHNWQNAALKENLFNKPESIPVYTKWNENISSLKNYTTQDISNCTVYRFTQAASFHRNYLLKELLPKYGIIII